MMPHKRFLVVFVTSLISMALAGCSFSLAADVTPPPGYRPPATQPPVAPVAVSPIIPPDPAKGKAIYLEKCAPCHGEDGKGNGPQADKLPNPVPFIGLPEVSRSARPVDWYQIISEGNLERFMPGFSGSLSDRQRWDVAAYVFSLSWTAQELAEGEAIYNDRCLACHGPHGEGDGAQAAGLPVKAPNWRNPARLAARSDAELWQAINRGIPPAMPAYADLLSDAQRWAVAGYIRSLSFTRPAPQPTAAVAGAATPVQKPEVDQELSVTPEVSGETQAWVNIRGQVLNASGGGIPPGLVVTLRAFEGMQPAFSAAADVKTDGSYFFPEVALSENGVFIASLQYQNMSFDSEALHAREARPGEDIYLPIQFYETSSDIAGLVADRAHVFFDFIDARRMQVVELFIIVNPTSRVIVPLQPGHPVLKFRLPEGAENLQFEEGVLGGRFIETAAGFGDLQAIPPLSRPHQVLFAYELPYDGKQKLSLEMPLRVEAAIVAVSGSGVKLESPQLRDAGQRNVEGLTVRLYSASNLAAGSELELAFAGKPRLAATAESRASGGSLVFGLSAFLLAALAAGGWYYRLQRAGTAQEEQPAAGEEPLETQETLLDAIIALDDLHRAGELSPEAYEERRAELKARLRALLELEQGGR